ncbi:NAD(P)-dependent oxidoreductase [Candidatus Woesearchaeota archaeon]|jgi:UDP-glucose 4-epimerase|nr:NAD(P)-dependent oxidoreductase [Candidatus Woesearchaeota archaeon]MBT5273099.1 NAD(P)-dependent oxidoreductase [Candidatus Woesearchaeota archaeon]MBT6041762.1 NAD(P)-dependent oxidoreductase [Candidatus Woesearchaeota archaeon]MBT6337586.1 NAD(P)-dependent oxidoreductase [Candidatus Woesearchaeota archaeon]MBT7927013.1 NAD(P)-dependent oxidoreductase [Candidatus Woesearchaeota archaeon]
MENDNLEFWKEKRVLVTGASGFIGSNLCLKLKDMGVEVITLSRTKNKELEDKKIKQYEGEITNQELVSRLVDKVDLIFHLAANPSVWKAQKDPIMDSKVNIIGTVTVLNAAKKDKKRVIFPSSIALYRNLAINQKCTEETKIDPDNFYSLSKYTCEQYCFLFHKMFETPISIARLSYVYGPCLQRGVIYDIIKQVVLEKKEEINLFMRPENKLNFIHIKDVINVLLTIASSQKAVGEIFNIGSDKDYDINEIMEFVGKQCNCVVKAKLLDHADKTKINFNVNYEKVREKLSWEPKYDLKSSLLKIITDIKKQE